MKRSRSESFVKFNSRKAVFVLLFIFPILNTFAQAPKEDEKKWEFSTNVVMSGSSDVSDPAGYMVYSALSIEPTIARKISKPLSVYLKFRTESHEVDYINASEEVPLGSIELIPVNLLLKYSLMRKSVIHPYVAAGGNITFCWEKSGALNSTDLTTSVGPAIALGMEADIHSDIFVNFNVGWNSLRSDIVDHDATVTKLTMDPVSIAAGIGFKF